jgi:hypothetical protein
VITLCLSGRFKPPSEVVRDKPLDTRDPRSVSIIRDGFLYVVEPLALGTDGDEDSGELMDGLSI